MIDEPYRPSPQALRRLREVDFVAVVGPSAVGKTTLIREALRREPGLRLVLNNTSRARRPDEVDGVDYRFETRARMLQRIELGEYAQVAPAAFGDLYATAADDYPTDGYALLPVLADAVADFRALPFRSVRAVFVVPPDAATWRGRLADRGFAPDRLAGRLAEARRSLEFARTDPGLLFVVNDDLATAAADFVALVTGQPSVQPARARRERDRALAVVDELLVVVDKVLTADGSATADQLAAAWPG